MIVHGLYMTLAGIGNGHVSVICQYFFARAVRVIVFHTSW